LWRGRPQERLRIAGLTCFLGGVLCLGLGIGWGRASLGDDAGFTDRYILLATPLIVLGYVIAVIGGNARGERVQVALLVLMCILLPINLRKGYRSAADFHSRFVALERDIRAGLPPAGLACRHAYIYPSEPVLLERLQMLRRHNFGAFANVDPAGPLREVNVAPLTPVSQWNDAAGQLRLKAGESLSRQFALAGGQLLSHIDLQASLRRGRTPPVLHWSLARLEGEQRIAIICAGEANLLQLDNQRFLTLPCSIEVPQDSTIELKLTVPAAAGPNDYAEFPTFRSSADSHQELNAFLFTRAVSQTAQCLAPQRK
jgi:hypothetical protein